MSKGADLSSVETLRDLVAAFQDFSRRRSESLDELERPLARRVERLEDRREAWERELRQRQRDYDDADDEEDDLGYLAMQVEEAEEQLRQVERWAQRVSESQAYFTRCANTIASGPDQRAIAFLQRLIAELEEYLATKIGKTAGSLTPLPGAEILMNVLNAVEQTVTAGFFGITEPLLPDGFDWIPLTAISAAEMENLPDDDDYKKVAKSEMQRGFATLHRDILPLIKQSGVDSDYFFQLDTQAGLDYERGLQRVYDAFFGGEPITLDSSLGDETFNITSGRHRIKVARELGWPAVPARLIG
jgi:hypothetical protein